MMVKTGESLVPVMVTVTVEVSVVSSPVVAPELSVVLTV